MSETPQQQTNLDYLAAKYSQQLISNFIPPDGDEATKKAKELENTVTKMLGILQSNGVYGFFLFAHSKSGGAEEKVKTEALNFLGEVFGKARADIGTLEKISDEFCREAYRNYLTQTILERYLVYARYHAKAGKD